MTQKVEWSRARLDTGVLNDMMSHSIEVARFLVTDPGDF
jgi:hypothetical protein